MIKARSATSVELPVSGLWVIAVSAADLVDPPTVTVTDPAGTSFDVPAEADSWDCYRAETIVDATGRWIARVVSVDQGAIDFTAFVTGVIAAAAMPTAGDVDTYLQSFGGHSWTPDDLQDALNAESDAQRRNCDVPAAYPYDLRQALLRRCWRNLAMRGQPLLTVPGAEAGTTTVTPGMDPEVRRLERPFRKLRAL